MFVYIFPESKWICTKPGTGVRRSLYKIFSKIAARAPEQHFAAVSNCQFKHILTSQCTISAVDIVATSDNKNYLKCYNG